jgi:hypothetical protein
LKEIIPKLNQDNKIDGVQGLLIVGYPYNEEQINALKFYNIQIDKFVVLSDEKNRNLAQRPAYAE